MAALRDHNLPNHNDACNPINFGTMAPNNFEMYQAQVGLIEKDSFGGNIDEDAHAHLKKFKNKVAMMKWNGVFEDTLRLMLFPLSLIDKADRWLNVHPPNTFTTWNALVKAFLAKYYPSSKTAMLRNEIHTFQQEDGESLGEAWDMYQDVIASFPHHGIPAWYVTQTFFQTLFPRTKEMVNASAGGGFDHLGDDEGMTLIKKMVDSESNYGSRGNMLRRNNWYPKENSSTLNAETNAKLDLLTKKLDQMQRSQVHQASASHGPPMEEVIPNSSCELCGGNGHTFDVCAKNNYNVGNEDNIQDVNTFQSYIQQQCEATTTTLQQPKCLQPNSNFYHPGLKNHPKFSYKSTNVQNPQHLQPQLPNTNLPGFSQPISGYPNQRNNFGN
ncbi:uncharacterized protein LOC141607853 [Silene latifolia]|uniref:uncharacterized protein LOC141607853 n=1 Tax=Silene latifolia TaxID=37657 RepID=UPI003D780ABC